MLFCIPCAARAQAQSLVGPYTRGYLDLAYTPRPPPDRREFTSTTLGGAGATDLLKETLCESGRCVDALKKRGRVLEECECLKKVCLVRGTGREPLLQKGWRGFLRRPLGGRVLKSLVEVLEFEPPSAHPLRINLICESRRKGSQEALHHCQLQQQTPAAHALITGR